MCFISDWVVTSEADQEKKDQVLLMTEVKVNLLLPWFQRNVCLVSNKPLPRMDRKGQIFCTNHKCMWGLLDNINLPQSVPHYSMFEIFENIHFSIVTMYCSLFDNWNPHYDKNWKQHSLLYQLPYWSRNYLF